MAVVNPVPFTNENLPTSNGINELNRVLFELDNYMSTALKVAKSFSFTSRGVGAGTYYVGGYYQASATDANLTQASTTVTYGSANIAYASHAFLVAGGAGSVDAGSCSIVVSGTSITDAGVRTPGDSQVIVSDITTMTTDAYYETPKKWIGQITYTLTPSGASTYSADFNYGLCKYEDLWNVDFEVSGLEVVGLAAANDSSFDIILRHHSPNGWTYAATGFAPTPSAICSMSTDHNTEKNASSGEYFAYKRDNLDYAIEGEALGGVVIEIVTGANNTVQAMDLHLYCKRVGT